VAGFCNMLWSELTRAPTTTRRRTLAVVFDFRPRPSATTSIDAYKANRPEPPEDLRPQFPLTREATRAFNVPCIEIEGYEADDIIATLARQAVEAAGGRTIISSDKDLMQLVGDPGSSCATR
jgi:DNA polymerase I